MTLQTKQQCVLTEENVPFAFFPSKYQWSVLSSGCDKVRFFSELVVSVVNYPSGVLDYWQVFRSTLASLMGFPLAYPVLPQVVFKHGIEAFCLGGNNRFLLMVEAHLCM